MNDLGKNSAINGEDSVGTMPARILHASTLHRRDDVRILLKEARSLAASLEASIFFIVQDGGADEEGPVSIMSSGRPMNKPSKRLTLGMWRMYRKILSLKPDIVHLHDPELILLGIVLKLHGIRVVQDVHENYREVVAALKRRSKPTRMAFHLGVVTLENAASWLFDGIICANDSITRNFARDDTIVVKNLPDAGEFIQATTISYRDRARNVAYIGGITRIRGVEEMIRALAQVSEPEARLLLAGSFSPPGLEAETRVLGGWERVDYLGWVGRDAVSDILSRARVGLLLLHPHGNHMEPSPTKLFEYMASGLPVIVSNFPFFQEFVSRLGIGITVDPLDPEEIARAIDWILAHPSEAEQMGRNGQRAIAEQLNWGHEAQKLVALYHHKFAVPLSKS